MTTGDDVTVPPEGESTGNDLLARQTELRDQLLAAGLLISSGVDGLYGRDVRFESTLLAVDAIGKRCGAAEHPRELWFPPFLPKSNYDKIAYLRNFPQLAGLVSSFHGDAKDHLGLLTIIDAGESYAHVLDLTELCMTPACCYPVYPTLAGILRQRVIVTVAGHCFRHEPSPDPMRMQSFRMREHIMIGDPDEVETWRNGWIQRAEEFFARLEIPMTIDVANDAFFGRTGKLLARNQRELELKLEFLVPVYGDEHPTACASLNLHREHFGELFGIHLDGGIPAHSSCFGFGLERITVALFAFHGLDPDRWPAGVRSQLAAAR